MYYQTVHRETLNQWAFAQEVKSAAAKFVLLLMAMQCDRLFLQIVFNNREAARKLHVTVKTVRKAVSELEELDLIAYRGKKQLDSYRYQKIWKLNYNAD